MGFIGNLFKQLFGGIVAQITVVPVAQVIRGQAQLEYLVM